MKTTLKAIAGVALAALIASPAAAQEAGADSVLYRSEALPVWVMVEDTDQAGVHQVSAAVLWDDYRSTLPFSFEIGEGDLVVLLASSDDPEASESCAYRSAVMAHGSDGFHPMERRDRDCLAPPAEVLAWVAVGHFGNRMECAPAGRQGGDTPERRMFACYWAEPPGGG